MKNELAFSVCKKTLDKERRKRLSLYLKRRRLELHKTQGEVAQGICTVSYYSRIENNLADVGEEYYDLLFHKLDVDYTTLKEERSVEVFEEIFKNYLLLNFNNCENLISKALSSNLYAEIECDLMLLFDNITKGLFVEAKQLLDDLQTKHSTFSEEEQIILTYLTILYAYKTNQGVNAYLAMIRFIEEDVFNPVFIDAIYDLALDIFTYTGSIGQFLKYYPTLNQNEFNTKYVTRALVHLAQYHYFCYSPTTNQTAMKLSEIRLDIDKAMEIEVTNLFIQNEYRFKKYSMMFDILESLLATPKTLAYKALLCLKMDSHNLLMELIDERNIIHFNLIDESYLKFVDIVILIKQKYDYNEALVELMDLLKYQVHVSFDEFFYQVEVELLLGLSMKVGRYRDTTKVLETVSMEIDDIRYTNFN